MSTNTHPNLITSQLVYQNKSYPCACEFFDENTGQLKVNISTALDPGGHCEITINFEIDTEIKVKGKLISSQTNTLNSKLFQVNIKLELDGEEKKKIKKMFLSPEENIVSMFENFQFENKGLKNKAS